MNKLFRALSAFLLIIVVLIIGLQNQIGAILPAAYGAVFAILILVLREFVKEKGQQIQNSFVMDWKYRLISVALMIVAMLLIYFEPMIRGYIPADFATLFAIFMLIVREAVKDKGLNVSEIIDEVEDCVDDALTKKEVPASAPSSTTTDAASTSEADPAIEDEVAKLEEDGA